MIRYFLEISLRAGVVLLEVKSVCAPQLAYFRYIIHSDKFLFRILYTLYALLLKYIFMYEMPYRGYRYLNIQLGISY